MARNRPVKLASARALAARAACKRASLSFAKTGRGVGFRCGSAAGGNVGEFDMFGAVSDKPTLGADGSSFSAPAVTPPVMRLGALLSRGYVIETWAHLPRA